MMDFIEHFQTIRSDAWAATVAPEHGGQLLRLRHLASGHDVLNYPKTKADFLAQSERFGVPVLFPPNRILDGLFTWEGRHYQLPVNEVVRSNHLHGFVRSEPWAMEVMPHASGLGTTIRLVYTHNTGQPMFAAYPHRFHLEISYELLPDAFVQSIRLVNEDAVGVGSMPFGLGFHTAFQLPENPNSKTRVWLTGADQCYAMEPQRCLPTGQMRSWPELHQYYRKPGAVYHVESPLSCHCKAVTGQWEGTPFRGAVLGFEDDGVTVVYEVSEEFDYWFLWAPRDDARVLCLEPMTCMANAANQAPSFGGGGWRGLLPGESWHAETRLEILSH